MARFWPIGLCFFALLCAPVAAQLSTASINGTVRDASGAALPEAELVLRNLETAVERQTAANTIGNYVFTNIPPGVYTLSARHKSFRVSTIPRVVLAVNQTTTLDFRLKVGSVTESVDVSAVGVEIQSSTVEVGSVIQQRQVVDLPLNGRNFTQLLTLTVGASPVSTAQNNNGFGTSTVGEFTFPAINGQSNRSNLFLTDGANNFGSYTGTYAVPPIIDTIQEFKVQSHNDQAEFGQVMGGTINVVTKSGTNSLHGSAWNFHRNDNLDARNFFRADVIPLVQNMYGGTLGGRIVPNKLFYFLGYQGFRSRTPASRLYRVPTAANLAGDLSDWPRPIFDPASTRDNAARPGTFLRDPFPGNRLPTNRLFPGFLDLARRTLPQPVATGVADRNALDLTPSKVNQEEYSARFDYNADINNFFWARMSGTINSNLGSGGREALGSLLDIYSSNFAASWVRVFSASSVLQVQFAKTFSDRFSQRQLRDLPGLAQDVGFNREFCCAFRGTAGAYIPNVNVDQFFNGGEGEEWVKFTDTYQYKSTFSKVAGNHQWKFGGEYTSISMAHIAGDHGVVFNSVETSDPQNAGATGSPLASFLLNRPNSANRRDLFKTSRPGGVMGMFVQDSWKATPRLTVNLGFRYDYTFFPQIGTFENNGIYTGTYDMVRGTYLLQAAPPACGPSRAAPCLPGGVVPPNVEVSPNQRISRNFTDNWQPRVGIAYRLGSRTAIRSGFGVYFDSWTSVSQVSISIGNLWPDVGQRQGNNLNVPRPGTPVPAITGTNPFPQISAPEPNPFSRVGTFADPGLNNAYSVQWHFGLQHQLASTLITANYVGSGNSRAPMGSFYNTAVTPGSGDARQRQPYSYITPTAWGRSWGHASYHGLQLQMQRRASNLTYMLNYTWSKTINVGCDGLFNAEGCAMQNVYDHRGNRSIAGQDLTHMFNASWVYELPIGPGYRSTGNRVLDHVIGRWQVNGILTLNSGRPYTVNLNGDIANTLNTNGYMRPNIVGEARLDNPTPAAWINTRAFAAPPAFTFGSAGRHILRADGTANIDLALFRDFLLPFREGLKIQFRAEGFNAFNSPQFAAPVANLSNTNFGRVTATANTERRFQLGLKILF
ncbi:MAG: TonB-dependent receptor [Acidobacteria bacterium]|nr:TonB-dependent receptor [Acidobacteriota bacterium]